MNNYSQFTEDPSKYIRYILLAFSAPKVLQMISMILLILVSFDNSYDSHIDVMIHGFIRCPLRKWYWIFIVILSVIAIVAGAATLEYLYYTQAVTVDLLIKAYLVGLTCVLITFIALECAKAKIFSGFPYIHPDKKERSKTIKKAILRYLLGAAVEITFSIYLIIQELTTDKNFEQWISGNHLKGLLLFIGLALQMLICELFPVSNVLDSYYLKVLARLESFHKIPLLPQEGGSQYKTMLSSVNTKSVVSQNSQTKEAPTSILTSGRANLSSFDINYLKPMSRISGLGTIYFAFYKGHTVVVNL
jgi:hypothetical protein